MLIAKVAMKNRIILNRARHYLVGPKRAVSKTHMLVCGGITAAPLTFNF